ncbi:UDP-glucose 6-phosphate dehydrogenase Ugd [Striga asiatica]|uniref:UDP-glucose 6-phosphate dehydrogenase Ugd n=1 Tax=Striga asiatica TaxID=4170 RepID=A0A5A7PX29_STRAF|nr:UDP-glucose 6-phosphate dehydrogenase Ugd [Striga asiatica]
MGHFWEIVFKTWPSIDSGMGHCWEIVFKTWHTVEIPVAAAGCTIVHLLKTTASPNELLAAIGSISKIRVDFQAFSVFKLTGHMTILQERGTINVITRNEQKNEGKQNKKGACKDRISSCSRFPIDSGRALSRLKSNLNSTRDKHEPIALENLFELKSRLITFTKFSKDSGSDLSRLAERFSSVKFSSSPNELGRFMSWFPRTSSFVKVSRLAMEFGRAMILQDSMKPKWSSKFRRSKTLHTINNTLDVLLFSRIHNPIILTGRSLFFTVPINPIGIHHFLTGDQRRSPLNQPVKHLKNPVELHHLRRLLPLLVALQGDRGPPDLLEHGEQLRRHVRRRLHPGYFIELEALLGLDGAEHGVGRLDLLDGRPDRRQRLVDSRDFFHCCGAGGGGRRRVFRYRRRRGHVMQVACGNGMQQENLIQNGSKIRDAIDQSQK